MVCYLFIILFSSRKQLTTKLGTRYLIQDNSHDLDIIQGNEDYIYLLHQYQLGKSKDLKLAFSMHNDQFTGCHNNLITSLFKSIAVPNTIFNYFLKTYI